MYKQGDIVLIPLPFTDLTSSKKRPVLILSNDIYNSITEDIIVAAITSNLDEKEYNVSLRNDNLVDGVLPRDSFIKPDKIYTLAQSIVVKKFGHVKSDVLEQVNNKINDVLRLKTL
jgi:mRNA interferase MazF